MAASFWRHFQQSLALGALLPAGMILADEGPAGTARISGGIVQTSCHTDSGAVYGPQLGPGYGVGVDGMGGFCEYEGCNLPLCEKLMLHRARARVATRNALRGTVRWVGCTVGCTGYYMLPHCQYTPLQPGYADPRDSQAYSAAGFDVPVSVPLAPVVRHTYNYGWGVPSSRITRVGAQYHRWYPNTWYSQAGSPEARSYVHPPVVGIRTDTTQSGFYYSHVPTWEPVPSLIGGTPRPLAVRMLPAQAHPAMAPSAASRRPTPAVAPAPPAVPTNPVPPAPPTPTFDDDGVAVPPPAAP